VKCYGVQCGVGAGQVHMFAALLGPLFSISPFYVLFPYGGGSITSGGGKEYECQRQRMVLLC
jgi:hypothetical protein